VAVSTASGHSDRQVRIGLVLNQPDLNRAADPVEYAAYLGLLRARRELHVEAKVAVPRPFVFRDLGPFDYLARQHYDLVIANGFLGGLPQAAHRFPKVKFAALDTDRAVIRRAPPNLEGTVFHSEQAAFLAGFVAARMADRGPRPHVVSSVGGIPFQQVKALIAGFRAGAKRADPKIRLLNTYTYDFANKAKCRNAALAQIVAHHSRVVFDVAGACGVGALEAAKKEGVYAIGVDSDQSYLGKFILTSAVLNVNLAVYDLAKRVVHGRLRTGGNLSFDLRNHGVYLGRFSPKVPLSIRRELIPLAAQIKRGKIVVPATLNRSP
jgi:basic membrane protein A